MSRALVTTALEDTWPSDGRPVLFLGEWCRLYNRRERWSAMDGEVLPYHWEDGAKFARDYVYLDALYERLLVDLGTQLNKTHGVRHSDRYWRILIGTWLGFFVQILYDRWYCIDRALARGDVTDTVILTGHDDAWVPNDTSEFTRLMTTDAWNHRVYAAILERRSDVTIVRRQGDGPSAQAAPELRLLGKFRRALLNVTKLLVRDHDAFVLSSYLPALDELRLQARLGQFPQLWRSEVPARAPVDWEQRQWRVATIAQNEFEVLVADLVPRHIPTLFLEGYPALLKQVHALPWPKQPKLIFSANGLFNDVVAAAYAAAAAEHSTPIVYMQHGGNFWVIPLHWGESHEVAIADQYLSWGMTDPRRPKIHPLCYIKPHYPRRHSSSRSGPLLLVTHNNPRYSYSLISAQKSTQVLTSYLDRAFHFVDDVGRTCGDAVVVRLTSTEYGWHFYDRWRDRFPSLVLDRGERKMEDLVRRSRLMVCTYCSTAFLEALASNVPVMLFWDPSVDPVSDSAAPFFRDLQRVGIYHETPDAAARHVKAIWDNVDDWWSSDAVRQVLQRFIARYCRTCEDRVETVAGLLMEVIHREPLISAPAP